MVTFGVFQVDFLIVIYLSWYPLIVLLVGACVVYGYVPLLPDVVFCLRIYAAFLANGARVVVDLDGRL